MNFRNRVASSARKTLSALALTLVVAAANPSAVAEPFGSPQAIADWRIAWTVIWNFTSNVLLGVPQYESTIQNTEVPPLPPPPPPGGGTAGGAGQAADPNGG